jgi:hypothetical protein
MKRATMSTQTQATQAVDRPLRWANFDDTAILFANHFLVQQQPDEFVISLGQVTGPPLYGPPEEIGRQAAEVTHVPIETLARVGMSHRRVTELIALLQAAVDDHDRKLGR